MLTSSTTVKSCDDGDSCVTWVEGKVTFRGCKAEKKEEILNFDECNKNDNCNNGIFPSNRIKCVSCAADDPSCIAPSADLLYPCKNYSPVDKCFTYVISMRIYC